MAVTLTEAITYRRLVAAANDKVFYEDLGVAAGDKTELAAADGDIDTSDQLIMFEAFQKAIVVNGTNLKIVDFANTKLTITALTTAPTRGSTVTQATSNATMVVDFVNTAKTEIYGYTTSGTFVTTGGYTLSGGGMDPATRVPSAVAEASTTPHWYDYTVYPGGSSGSLPAKAYLGCLYRGRVILSGNPNNPEQWYMSKQSNIFNYAYATNDAQSAVAGSNADAGEIGDICRSLIPYRDDYLVFGCANSIWVLRGDPAIGGSLDEVDLTVGMYGANSWCFDGDGNLFFWGTNGIYMMKKDFGGVENLSEVSLPELVEDEAADPSTHRITFDYDRKRRGIVIWITKLSDGSNSNYFLSLNKQTLGIFPESFPDECGVYSSIYYDANDKTLQGLLMGCKDGYVRWYVDSEKDDDIGGSDTAISSYVVYPIVQLGDDDREGKLTSLTVELAGGASGGAHGDTDGVTVELFRADDAETLIEDIKDGATAFTSKTYSGAGRQPRLRKRMRGAYAAVKLSNSTASETWAVNRILYEAVKAGRIR
ncbi:MAG: hypothetical protein ACXABY_27310 [Candidatus Thorarchaeota archaeon]|jgi:hypothetical protein